MRRAGLDQEPRREANLTPVIGEYQGGPLRFLIGAGLFLVWLAIPSYSCSVSRFI